MTTVSRPTQAPRPAAPSRRRNDRGRGAQLRADILAAAADLLDETGDEQAVSLRAVARRVGITAPAIYAHFADRQEILLAVVQSAFAGLAEALRAAAGPDPDPHPGPRTAGERDPAEAARRLRAVCAAYLGFAAGSPQRYRVMFGGLWNGQAAVQTSSVTVDQVTGLGQDSLALIAAALDLCVATGGSTSSDTRTDTIALWLGLHGLAHQRAVLPAFGWPPEVAEHLVDALAHLVA